MDFKQKAHHLTDHWISATIIAVAPHMISSPPPVGGDIQHASRGFYSGLTTKLRRQKLFQRQFDKFVYL